MVGTSGRLFSGKEYELLVKALACLGAEGKNLRITIPDEGKIDSAMEKKETSSGIVYRVLVSRYIDHLRRHLLLLDVFVMPSLSEGLPCC